MPEIDVRIATRRRDRRLKRQDRTSPPAVNTCRTSPSSWADLQVFLTQFLLQEEVVPARWSNVANNEIAPRPPKHSSFTSEYCAHLLDEMRKGGPQSAQRGNEADAGITPFPGGIARRAGELPRGTYCFPVAFSASHFPSPHVSHRSKMLSISPSLLPAPTTRVITSEIYLRRLFVTSALVHVDPERAKVATARTPIPPLTTKTRNSSSLLLHPTTAASRSTRYSR